MCQQTIVKINASSKVVDISSLYFTAIIIMFPFSTITFLCSSEMVDDDPAHIYHNIFVAVIKQ